MEERRAEQRGEVSWSVRVWLGEGVFAVARAVDASASGMRLTISPRAEAVIRVEQSYNLEVESPRPLSCLAEVRHRTGGVGVVFKERRPELVGFPAPADTRTPLA